MVAKRYGSRQERRAARQKARTEARRTEIKDNREKVQAERAEAASQEAPAEPQADEAPVTADEAPEAQEEAKVPYFVDAMAEEVVVLSVAKAIDAVGDDKELAARVLELEGVEGRKTLIAALEEVIDG